jgi:TM2 domain-containing membrane protein YozV
MNEKDVKRDQSQSSNPQTEPKSKLVAGLLGIFVGGLGIHNFYLGYTNRGVTQLLLATVGYLIIIGPFIASVWGLIEGIQILTGSTNTDANGNKLTD